MQSHLPSLPQDGSSDTDSFSRGAQDTPGYCLASPSHRCPSRGPEPGTWRVGARHAHLVASCSRHGSHLGLNTTAVWWVASQRPCGKEVKPDPGSQYVLAWRFKYSGGSPVCGGLGLMPGSTAPEPALARARGVGPVTSRRGNLAFIRPK